MRVLPAIVSLALVVPSWAAPPKEHEVKPGGFARLSVDGASKATVLWDVKPDPIQQDEIAGVLVFTGNVGTEYLATAIVIDFEKKTAEKLRHVVRFGGAPVPPTPPPPVPGPDVPPLPPDNPPALSKAADGMLAVDRKRLASALRVAASKMDRAATRGDGEAVLAAEVERANVVVHDGLRESIAAALNAACPSEPARTPLTDRDRAALGAVLKMLADQLEAR